MHELARLLGGDVVGEEHRGRGHDDDGRHSSAHGRASFRARLARDRRTRAADNLFVEEARRWLPNATLAVDVAAAEAPRSAPLVDGAERPARILVVDDNADMREYLARMLAPHWTVETAVDGEAALASIRARRPDVVLTDVMMPNLDGFGLVARLRANEATADLPVIVLSARAGRGVAHRGAAGRARTTTSSSRSPRAS